MTESPAEQQSGEEAAPQPHPWADLATERFELLRLSPLPIDRHTGVRPLRFVELGRVERHSREQSLLRLVIELPGQKVRKDQKRGDYTDPGWYKHPPGTVAYEFTGAPPEPARFKSEGTGSMPVLARPAQDVQVKVRKPGGGHGSH